MPQIDLHLHTLYSRRSPEWPLRRIGFPASTTKPRELYQQLRQAGMDFVTFTDDDTIEGCLEIAGLEGSFISEQVTASFPEDGCHLPLLIWNISEAQHASIQELKENIYELEAYLTQEKIVHGVAAPLQGMLDHLEPQHLMKIALLFRHIEGIHGRSSGWINEITRFLFTLTPADIELFAAKTGINPTHERPWQKFFFGGSDDHSGRHCGRTYTKVEEGPSLSKVGKGSKQLPNFAPVSGITDFFQKMQQGKATAAGEDGTPLLRALDIYQIALSFIKEHWHGKKRDHIGFQLLEKAAQRFMEGRDPTVFSAGDKWSFFLHGVTSGKIFELIGSGNRSLWKELSSSLSESSMRTELARQIDGVEDPSRRAFGIGNLLTSRLTNRFVTQSVHQFKKGQLVESLQMLSPLIPLALLLSPYFYSFRRPAWKRLRQAALSLHGKTSFLLSYDRRAWFTDTLDDVNGVATTIQKMTSATKELGHHLTVVVSRSQIQDLSIPLKNFTPIGEFELPEYEFQTLCVPPVLPIMDYLERERISQVIISTPGPVGLGALLAAKILGLPTIGIYHTDFPQYVRILTEDGLMETLTWNFMHWFYSQMDLMYVNSEHYRHCWVERDFPPEKIAILPRGLDTELFHPKRRNESFWQERGLQPGEVGALFVGRISREKNLDLLAAAFRRLLSQRVPVRPLFVGDGPYAKMLQELLPEALFTGSLHKEELAVAYASADFFVFPSTTDTFGNVVIEAHASGIPTIVSDVGGPKDLVTDQLEGKIVKGLDLEELVAAIAHLVKEEETRKSWGAAARKRVEKRSWSRAAELFWEEMGEIS